MSIKGLSTELDDRIIHYLQGPDARALGAMSRVSKYYHSLAEPILYRDITMFTGGGNRIKLLLMTLLDRTDLARQIKAINLTDEMPFVSDDLAHADKEVHDRLSDYADVSRETIKCFRDKLNAGHIALDWHNKVLARRPPYDGALALVLTMASEVEKIKIRMTFSEPLKLTRKILALPWITNDSPRSPFKKMTNLAIEGLEDECLRMSDIPNLPSLREFRASEFYVSSNPLSSLSSKTQLHTLELEGCTLSTHAATALASNAFREIKKLLLRDINADDIQEYLQTFSKHLPKVEILECSKMSSVSHGACFGGFENVKELLVDTKLLLLPRSEWSAEHASSVDLLPPGIQWVELAD